MQMDILQHDELPFPQSLPEFQRLFPDNESCVAYLLKLRWPCTTDPTSTIADSAHYYKARSTHALAAAATTGYTFANARTEYDNLITNYPASIFVDNASYHSAFTYHDSTRCTLELAAMQAFVSAYPASFYLAAANTHISDLILLPPVTHTPCN